MNEQLFYDIGQQKHIENVTRAERNVARQAARGSASPAARDRIALGLVSLATRLQPALSIQVQRPAEPAAA